MKTEKVTAEERVAHTPQHSETCSENHCVICGWAHDECCDNSCACAEANEYRRKCATNTLALAGRK